MITNLIPILSHPVVERIGWTLLHSLWQGVAIGLVLFLVLKQLRTAERRHAACLGALMLMLLGTVETFRLARSDRPDGVRHEAPTVDPSLLEVAPVLDVASALAPSAGVVAIRRDVRVLLTPFLPWLGGSWMLGVALLSLKQLCACALLRHWRRRHCHAAGVDLVRMLQRVCHNLGIRRAVRLLESGLACTPMLLGWFKPMIVLPASVVTGLSREQLEAVLAHELAHLRRGDVLVLWFQRLMETVFFFQPAVWWISRQLQVEREHCCDDAALAAGIDRTVLASTLGRLALVNEERAPDLALAATGKMPVLERIRRLLQPPPFARRGMVSGFMLLVQATAFATALVLTLVNCGKESSGTGKSEPATFATSGKFVANAKVIVGEPQSKETFAYDYIGTQIEILKSGELHRRAEERLNQLYPTVKGKLIELQTSQVGKTAVVDLNASADNADYARNYLNSLLDEFVGFKREIFEKSLGAAMNKVIEEVLSREKQFREKQAKVNSAIDQGADPKQIERLREELAQTKEDYYEWKKTLDRLDADHVLYRDNVQILQRP